MKSKEDKIKEYEKDGYKIYDGKIAVQPVVKTVISRIKFILAYVGDVYIRSSRYFYEFIFDYPYKREFYIYVERILKRYKNVRFGVREDGNIVFVVEKYIDVFK
jgi:hypothetical protein